MIVFFLWDKKNTGSLEIAIERKEQYRVHPSGWWMVDGTYNLLITKVRALLEVD